MNAEPTAEQIVIANLAVQMLPKIDPPEKWQTMHPHTLGKHIHEATTGKGHKFDESYTYPAGWATAWETLSEEAVRRARLLLDAAAGLKRQERIDCEKADREAKQQMEAYFAPIHEEQRAKEEEDKRRLAPFLESFKKIAKGRSAITEDEFIQHLFAGNKTPKDRRLRFFRAYQKDTHGCMIRHTESDGSFRYEQPLQFDEVMGTWHADGFWRWMEANRERLAKQWKRAGNRKGGETTTANLISEGEIIGISAKEQANLDAASKRAESSKPAKKRARSR